MTTNTNNPTGKYASVNGINLYYEIHGTGKPLIMFHGGFGTFEMFAALSPALAEKYQVIGVDLYGHGRTALTDRPIRFEQMADDIAGLIHHLGLEKADLLGFSLGGAVALQTAIRHPERVAKLVEAMGQDYDWTERVSALRTPTLIIAGDSDGLPPSHAVAFFNLFGGGLKDAGWNGEHLIPSQLAILPGATHYNTVFRADLLLPVLSPFLDEISKR